ncbi:MAG: hypothetical protein KIS73_28730 [Enhydrobacter sp.]|nr:hypothetical protein [Enhydrobacter sp.]
MTRLLLAIGLVFAAFAASAQSRNQATNAGAAGVNARLHSQGYKDIRNLRPGPAGKWVGKATRNGAPVTVTTDRAGTTIAR